MGIHRNPNRIGLLLAFVTQRAQGLAARRSYPSRPGDRPRPETASRLPPAFARQVGRQRRCLRGPLRSAGRRTLRYQASVSIQMDRARRTAVATAMGDSLLFDGRGLHGAGLKSNERRRGRRGFSRLVRPCFLHDGGHGRIEQLEPDLHLAAPSSTAAGRIAGCWRRRGARAVPDETPGQ